MDVDFCKHNAKNANTTKATNTWYENFQKWARCAAKESNIELLDKHELNSTLELYFASIMRTTGSSMSLRHYELCKLGSNAT